MYKMQTTEEFMNVNLYGTAVEFKIDISQDPSNVLPQALWIQLGCPTIY